MTVSMHLITPDKFVTTNWSGGKTRQLAIGPKGAVYGDRNFLWRVSSATVEVEKSDFTPLPDYMRYLSTIEGAIRLKHGEEREFELLPGSIDYFDGGEATVSYGLCTDFNLMLRKDSTKGSMVSLKLGGFKAVSVPQLAHTTAMVLYCTKGRALAMDGDKALDIKAGEAILWENPHKPFLRADGEADFMLALISE